MLTDCRAMPRPLPLALLAAALLLPASSALAAKGAYRAEIRRTTGGVPHVKARDYGSLGYGYGYAYAQDQICEYASIVITVSAQRSRYFGTDAESPNGGTNLQSDFFWKRINDARTVERLAKRSRRTARPRRCATERQGLRRGLQRVPAQDGPRQAARPDLPRQGVGAPDHDARRLPALLPARPARELGQLPARDRRPPRRRPPAAPRRPPRRRRPEQLRERLAGDPVLGTEHPLGSNAYGVGSAGTRGGRSVLLGNPHFPWQGSERWYELHLTVPGQARRDRRRPAGRAGGQHRLQRARRVEPHGLDRAPLHAVRAEARSPATRRSYLVDGQAR